MLKVSNWVWPSLAQQTCLYIPLTVDLGISTTWGYRFGHTIWYAYVVHFCYHIVRTKSLILGKWTSDCNNWFPTSKCSLCRITMFMYPSYWHSDSSGSSIVWTNTCCSSATPLYYAIWIPATASSALWPLPLCSISAIPTSSHGSSPLCRSSSTWLHSYVAYEDTVVLPHLISLTEFCNRYEIDAEDCDRLAKLKFQPGDRHVDKLECEDWHSHTGFSKLSWDDFLVKHKQFVCEIKAGNFVWYFLWFFISLLPVTVIHSRSFVSLKLISSLFSGLHSLPVTCYLHLSMFIVLILVWTCPLVI